MDWRRTKSEICANKKKHSPQKEIATVEIRLKIQEEKTETEKK